MKALSLIRFFLIFVLVITWSLPVAAQNIKIDSLKNLLKLERKDNIPLLLQLCWEFRYSNPDTARFYGYKALVQAKKIRDKKFEGEALHNLAITYEAQSNFNKAIELGLKALTLKTAVGDELEIANTLNNLGNVYDQKGEFDKAVTHYKKAYLIYKKNKLPENIAMINVNMGIVLKAQKQYQKVLPYYHEAYEIYRKLNKPFETAACEANLGSVHFYLNNSDSCVYYSSMAEKRFLSLKNEQFLPVVRSNIGMAYRKLGNFGKAISYLEKAIAAHRKFNNRKELSFVLSELAKTHQGINNNKALVYAKEALLVSEEISSLPEVLAARKVMSEIYQDKGEFRNAYESFIAYSTLKDSVFEKDKIKELNEFQTLFETEKKEQRIKVLSQQHVIQALKVKQREILLVIAVAAILFGLLIFFLVMNRRKLREENRLQEERNKQQEIAARRVLDAEEHERRRIASDLHDGVGQMLSVAIMNINSLAGKISENEESNILAKNSLALVTDCYDEMRSISHQMIPSALLKAGLAPAIRDFISRIDQNKIKVDLSLNNIDNRLSEQTETVLYRVIQETVNNVIKHSNASKLSIQIDSDGEELSAIIEDNGQGFDKESVKKGLGIENMISRIKLLNGAIEFDSRLGSGTIVAIYLPL